MKRMFLLAALSLLLVLVFSVENIWSQVPKTISYQGILTDAGGIAVPDGYYSLTFGIYDVSSGGSSLWQEVQPTVAVSKGVFNVILGSVTTLNLAFDKPYWLGIRVGTGSGMSPRIALTSSTYSLNSDKVKGTANVFPGSGNVGIGTTSPGEKLEVAGVIKSSSGGFKFPDGSIQTTASTSEGTTGDNLGNHTATQNVKLSQHWLSGDGDNEGVYVTNSGVVGIGTSNPATKLHLKGTGPTDAVLFFEPGEWNSVGDYGEVRFGDERHYIRGEYNQGMTFFDANKFQFMNANVGIGTLTPGERLEVAGVIKSSSGGFKFPDGSVQTTAASGGGTGDNLGNHTATQNVKLNGHWLSGDGGDEGVFVNSSGNVGIGTSSPEFRVSLDNDGGIIAKGTFNSGSTLTTSGAGTRLIWYPKKVAFRAGVVAGSEWNDENIGFFSVAMGFSTIASGTPSTAMGHSTKASGNYSTAMGRSTTASGQSSTVMGFLTAASGDHSTAMGYQTTASGGGSTAMGNCVEARNIGSFIIGDAASAVTGNARINRFDNNFQAHFAGGYHLYTVGDIGLELRPNSISWIGISDSTRKEHFLPTDGETVMAKFRSLRLGSWHMKKTPPGQRHYGPMAQEWFAAFGNDGRGVIGDDTTLASSDVDGILCIAVKALEKRTTELRKRTEELETVKAELAAVKVQLSEMKRINETLARLEYALMNLGINTSMAADNESYR